MLQDLEKITQPAILPAVRAGITFLVFPMGCNAQFRHLMHLPGADLDLDPLVLGPDYAGVKRAIPVRLWCGNVILEPAGNDPVVGVNDAERGVAVLDRVDDDAKGHDVGQLLERNVLALHLQPDRPRTLLAPRHCRFQPLSRKRVREFVYDAPDNVLTFAP